MGDFYVFGYGSLIWKVDFEFETKTAGFIKGFSRRFWQHSEDHRGAPGEPGRVVMITDSSDSEEKVWGMAYKIPQKNLQKTKDHLDNRETGYIREVTTFYPKDKTLAPFELEVYVATADNPFYAGPISLGAMALQIYTSKGKSGTNLEYFTNLVKSLKPIVPEGKEDGHLTYLEKQIGLLKSKKSQKSLNITDSRMSSSRIKGGSLRSSNNIIKELTSDSVSVKDTLNLSRLTLLGFSGFTETSDSEQ